MKKSNLLKGLFVLAVIAIALVPILNSILITKITPDSRQDTEIEIKESKQLDIAPIFHGEPLGSDDCASCHTQPIIGFDCMISGCHGPPPTIIDGDIIFPHHDPTPGGPLDNCSSIMCHDAGDDIRYVTVLDGNHIYCMQCHTENRCHRCHGSGPPDYN